MYSHLVKSSVLRNVLDYDVGQLVRGNAGMVAQDLLALLVRPDGEDDIEAVMCQLSRVKLAYRYDLPMLQQDIHDVSGNKATAS